MLLELAIGDAYGADFEYANENVAAYNDLSRYVRHPHHAIGVGYYTDDTQMTLAVTEVIVEQQAWTALKLAQQFITAIKRNPCEGYAGRFQQFLQQTPDGDLLRHHPT
jgi:ADP-ribosylglycohydrolase